MGLGMGLAIEVKDAKKLREALDTAFRSLPSALETEVNLAKRSYRGTDVHTLVLGERRGIPLAPTWAIHNGWLTIGIFPQTVHGFVLRSDGKHATWKPSPEMQEVVTQIKKNPKARLLALTQSDPRQPLKDAASFSPFFVSAINGAQQGDFDISTLPNFQAIIEPLFPNVGVVLDDGETLRLETYGSLGLPFDALGLETYWFPTLIFGQIL